MYGYIHIKKLTYSSQFINCLIPMLTKRLIFIIIICQSVLNSYSQNDWLEWGEQMEEESESTGWQEQYEELSELAAHPFNINTITKEQLEQLPFLSDKMIENILYYIYKNGPMKTKNELLGVEGMDWKTRKFLSDFIYIGPSENKKDKIHFRNLLKYNQQELITRVDIPFQLKSGYADYDATTLEKSPNKQYYGGPVYTNLRYRWKYRDQLFIGFTAEKDAGEPFFSKYNRKGYDFYSWHLFLKNIKKIKALAFGHYRASFGYGLVMNTNGFYANSTGNFFSMNRAGKGLAKYTSTGEADYLQGVGGTYRLANRWEMTAFYSFRQLDARVENGWIRSLKTDGYHRLRKDLEKKNATNNHLIGSNISYNGKYMEFGLTTVYTSFNKVLNPDFRPYNLYYPRGRSFLNSGINYKFFLKRWIFSGETAIDKNARIATLNMLTFSPSVNTSFLLINRYYDKRYQSLHANAFGENSSIQNETGCYLGLETRFLSHFTLFSYTDLFFFPYRRYQVDALHTTGGAGMVQLGYSPSNSLSMLIKYSYKNKAKNYTDDEKEKWVLPFIRQRWRYQLSYAPNERIGMKAVADYTRTSYLRQSPSRGYLAGGSLKAGFLKVPLQFSLSGAWFKTDDYNARVYFYEPNVLYAFSMMTLYGKGMRWAMNAKLAIKDWLALQMKYGWTHYADRNKIGQGTEEIQGNNKSDLILQLRAKW